MADLDSLVNAVGRPFTWSFSALNDFDTCPRQYAAKRFFCTVKDDTNEANVWGTRAHTACELRLRDGVPLAEEFAEYEPYCAAILRAPGFLYTEQQVAFDRNFRVVEWFSPQAWGRAILDVLLVNDDTVWIWDWKSGKIRPNSTQLKLFAAVASLVHPDVERFVTRYVWLKHHSVTGEDFTAADLPGIWAQFQEKIRLVELAWRFQNFPCNPSGLFRGWCPVTECEHWRPKR